MKMMGKLIIKKFIEAGLTTKAELLFAWFTLYNESIIELKLDKELLFKIDELRS